MVFCYIGSYSKKNFKERNFDLYLLINIKVWILGYKFFESRER